MQEDTQIKKTLSDDQVKTCQLRESVKQTLKKQPSEKKPISALSVVRNFTQVIEARDIHLMNKELYQFLNLDCGFIAHYDINGFKSVYSDPKDFADIFIRHFDHEHKYFNKTYPCHQEPYKETGYTKAEIKQEFCRVVQTHKDSIGNWAEQKQKRQRYAVYLLLKKEFEATQKSLNVSCEACETEYEVRVKNEGKHYSDFDTICCLFCGNKIKLY